MAMRPDTVALGSQCHVALLDPRCCDVVSVVEGQKAREVSRPSFAYGAPSSQCVCQIARQLSRPLLLVRAAANCRFLKAQHTVNLAASYL